MNADLKRVRENAGEDGSLSPSAKRRAMSLSTPPVQDGDDNGTEDWMRVVEVGFSYLPHRHSTLHVWRTECACRVESPVRRAGIDHTDTS